LQAAVKLIPFSAQYVRLNDPLPVGLRDAGGRLLLVAGRSVENEAQLAELTRQALFVDESESAEWTRRLGAAMEDALLRGASLKDVASVRPDSGAREAVQRRELTLPEEWGELVLQLDSTLRDVRADSDWRRRLMGVHARARLMVQRKPDASLYHLVYEAATSSQKYSAHHALLTYVICEQSAALLGWEQAWIDAIGRAALTMNVAMQRLQDQLAVSHYPPTNEQRAQIDAHAAVGARLLREAGLGDELAAAVVALHHQPGPQDAALAPLPPERQLARLLARVDAFAAKISLRASRAPMSPVQAAREACLRPDGTPDEVGAALLKAVGLYPPGSFVELVSGELGIVVARGRRANLPFVASLVSSAGHALGEPALRDTIDRRHAVRAAVPPSQVKVRPPHERLMAMR
jgi:HD-GYP domain-containing protein (c-di-GMP phosphodiesterase class II)